jgi:UDP-3-O-[3-hydroxymyristoyl] glucosamine N-acyltransferase
VGDDTIMAGHSGIAGSTRIGARFMVGGQAGIAGHLKVVMTS